MSTLGNILWFLIVGLWSAIIMFAVGIAYCVTIIGIPVGVQCFKIAGFVLMPFGKEVYYGNGGGSMLLNVIWLLLGGLESALGMCIIGAILCVTIIGIPFGKQCFKIAKLVLMPFGATFGDKNIPVQ